MYKAFFLTIAVFCGVQVVSCSEGTSESLHVLRLRPNTREKRQRIVNLLAKSIDEQYERTAGNCMYGFAAAVGAFGAWEICEEFKNCDRSRWLLNDRQIRERFALMVFFALVCGGVALGMVALGYYVKNHVNSVITMAREHGKYGKDYLFITRELCWALNNWFEKISYDLEKTGMANDLYLVDNELSNSYAAAKKDRMFRDKCEFALRICIVLGIIDMNDLR